MTGRLLLAISALAIAMHVHADDWADGNAAFERGDYAAALSFFEAGRDSGLTGPAIHYNLAVCQYKLERYAEAGKTFEFIARKYPQMAGLAEYNLGLVSQRLGDTDAASEHFLRAYRLSPDDETIRVLASNQLADIEPEERPASAWSGAFGVRAGHDDNIALRDTAGIPLGVTTESPMLDIFASVSRPFSVQSVGLRFEGNLYGVRYFDADDFNQNEISAGVMYEWRPGSWRIAAGASAGAGWLGGDAFDRRIGLGVEGSRSLGGGASANLAYYYDDISEGNDIFNGIGGKRHHVVARYRQHFSDGRRVLVRLRHENNDRLDPGVSPTRTGLAVDYRYLPDAGWGFEAGASYRRSRFSDAAVSRTENLFSARSALTRYFIRDWILLIEYRYSNNDSSNPEFSYDRNTLTIGAMRAL
ncbi:MAG: tetratricopeptide repeat protein [Gammaproteobacteria bacterium]|nr:tetratricopeptide repeat protein [Gammaproteobacteria bacterium]